MYLSWCSIFEMSTFLQYLYLSGPREHGRFSGGEAEGRGSMERITSWLFPSGGRRYRLESRLLTLSKAPRDWLGWSLLVLMSSHESSSTSTATRAAKRALTSISSFEGQGSVCLCTTPTLLRGPLSAPPVASRDAAASETTGRQMRRPLNGNAPRFAGRWTMDVARV